ncbi:hypothetical protein OPY27_03125 [Pseudomonas aeruginosa]|uniref:hypothetical protein n=1 Tax=Pseudomonas aeruginosa TaxID=287 RepID=UPI0031FE9A41|nr:hypothetical protein [Pseudomonas aeruginosa]
MFDGTDWTTVLVGLIGAAAGAGPTLYLHLSGVRRERQAVRAAILAEIRALVDLIERRGYLSHVRTEYQTLSLSLAMVTPFTQQEVAEASLRVLVPPDYNLIYRENATRLGCLEPGEAAQVVKFYQLIQSVIADVTPGGLLYEGTREARQISETLAIFEEAMRVGKALS